jgi:26S proteasome regulatory subunit N4
VGGGVPDVLSLGGRCAPAPRVAMGYTRDSPSRAAALALMKERDSMEAEMSALIALLTAPGAPGLAGNLVDAEGFPRADVNIHEVRTQRNRLACLRTDHKVATDKIEALLHEVLAPGGADAAAATAGPPPAAAPVVEEVAEAPLVPRVRVTRPAFAAVDEVSAGSPASAAGLAVGDRVVAFGAISLRTMPNAEAAMGALPGCLQEHEGRSVTIAVSRAVVAPGVEPGERELVELQLTPERWGGPGLLGCHVVVVPVEEDSRYTPQVATMAASRISGNVE